MIDNVSHQKMSNLELGDLAEQFVELWTTQAGFTVTAVQKDRRGWDHFVEFSSAGRPAGLGPPGLPAPEFAAKVQVKATSARLRQVRVKLSNLQRAVEDVLPCFVLAMRIPKGESQPSEVALIHIGKSVVESVLKRICHLPRESRAALHKQKVKVSWTASDRLAEPFADSLRARIHAAIGNDALLYAKMKRRWYDTAGLEDGSHRLNFTVQGDTDEDLYRRLATAAVGLDDNLPVSNLSFSITRFGLTEQAETPPPSPTAFVAIQRSSSEASEWVLIVSRSDGAEALTLKTTVRSACAVFPALPLEFEIVRLQTALLEIVLEPGTNRSQIGIKLPPPEQRIALADLSSTFELLRMLNECGDQRLACELLRGSKPGLKGSLGGLTGLPSAAIVYGRHVTALARFARAVSADMQAEFLVEEVEDVGSLAQFMVSAKERTPLSVIVDASVGGDGWEAQPACTVVTNLVLRIGDLVYGELVTLTGRAKVVEKESEVATRVRIEGNSLSSLQSVKGSVALMEAFDWDAAYREAYSALAADGHELIIWARRPATRR